MPTNPASLRITERYRARMVAIRERAQREARATWRKIDPDRLDDTYEVGMLTLTVSTLQREAARLSGGYLRAFVESELREPAGEPLVDARQVGQARNGDQLRKALESPMITTKVAIKDGHSPREALAIGRSALERMVGLATDTAAREALRVGMEATPDVVGWRRAVKGTCGACMGAATGTIENDAADLDIHPNCQCVSEPAITGRPTKRVSTDKLDPVQQAIANRALSAIESVHRYPPDMPATTMVADGAAGGARADFVLKPDGQGVVRFAEGDIPNTPIIAHELGHRIDAGIGGGRWITDSAFQPANDVLDAVKGSKAFRTLVEGETPEKVTAYYTNHQELFARAYAQWIGERTGISVGTEAERSLGIQWAEDDFAPIAKKLEALFRSEGLLVE